MKFSTNLRLWRNKFTSWNRTKKILFISGTIVSLCLLFVMVLYFATVWGWIDKIPSSQELTKTKAPIASNLLDNRGNILGKYYIENRSSVVIEDLNDFYKNALIATEDIRFYDHNGVDKRSLLRVVVKSLVLQKDASGGGSTITQQLAKNLFPRKKYKLFSTLINKFREMEIARRLEKIYSKDEILARYSNTVSFGERAFGIHTASHRFFNKKPNELLLEEAATLVGMLKATSFYNPRNYPERAKLRRNVVLSQMVKNDFLSTEAFEQLASLTVTLNYQAPSSAGESAKYFKELIKKEFNEWALTTSKSDGSKYDLFKDGLSIVSTLDIDLQNKAEEIMSAHMRTLQRLFLESWEGGKIFGNGTKVIDDKITSDEYYKRLRKNGLNGKEALAEFTKHKNRRLWSWNGKINKSATKIDSFKHYLTLLHTGILAAEPSNGEIKTWVGGNDFSQFPYDNITGARQVGSTFKPIVYLAALLSDAEPCDVFENELKTYTKYDDWTPKNSNGEYGGQVSLKGALTHSINTVSVQVLFNAGIDKVVELAKKLGVENKLNAVPSIVLGTSDVSLLEMVQVYATLANRGEKVKLHGIKQIVNRYGEILYEATPGNNLQKEQIADQRSVDILNEMLLNVSVEGTARRLYRDYRIPYPVSGKTGTTQNQSDGWYIGYNQDLVIGSWVGTMDRRIHFRNLGTGSGGATALPMVGGLFEYAGRNGYLHQKRLPDTGVEDCDDFILDEELMVNEIMDLKDRMDQMKKDIMGEYLNVRKTPASIKKNRFKKKKRDQERDKRYKAYKQAVKDLENKLEALKDQLDELDS